MAKKQTQNNKIDGIIPSDLSIEDILGVRNEDERFQDKLIAIAQQQIKTSLEYKKPRMEDAQKSIDLYNGKTKKALKGRWNIPLPIMSGYVDTLLSKTDDPPKLKFTYQDMADLSRAKKVQAKWEQDSSAVTGRWNEKDRQVKKLASFYGVGILKYFAYNDTKGMYGSHIEVIDPLDFECEPMGGQNLRNHKFYGQRNIFKTKAELEAGATGKDPIYNKKEVLRLSMAYSPGDHKVIEKLYIEKTDRLRSLGFNPDTNNYVGVTVFSMTEWYMEYDGIWYYILMEPHTGIAVRFDRLSNVFESGFGPFESWHTHPDPFNFWSKAPADDMRPVAEGMNIIFNQALDNREKKNYGQRAYDPAVFPDPSQLEWRPDGLVETTSGISSAQGIGAGVYKFDIADMPESGTINLMQFMDNFTGLKTGVTSEAQGESDEKRVGIYYGNLQQIADRLGLYNKAYSECWGRLGLLYYWGLREHIKTNKLMVKMIGQQGYNWVELVKDDTDPLQEFNIEVVGGQAQAQLDEITKKTRMDSLVIAAKLQRINPDVATEEILRSGGWEEGQIKRIMDMQSYGSEEIIAEAHQAIQDILAGEKPRLNRGATTIFMQTILDFAYDSEDLSIKDFITLKEYAEAHVQFATENAMRKVNLASAQIGAPMGQNVATPAVPGVNPGSPDGETAVTPKGAESIVKSQNLANISNI